MTRSIKNAFVPDLREAREHPWRGFISQFVLVTVAALLYFAVRMVTKEAESTAFENAENLLHFERLFGLDWELSAQSLILDNHALVTMWNWIYIWFHWPVILGALFLLFRYRRSHFLLFRNALFLSGAIGLIIFVTFPVAPPRFITGFEDTVTNLSTSYKYLQPPAIINKYAALPSFHVGWNVLAGLVIFQATRIRIVKVFAIVSPTLMTAAVVFTANHWVIDAIVGSAIALVGYAGAVWIRRRTEPTSTGGGSDADPTDAEAVLA